MPSPANFCNPFAGQGVFLMKMLDDIIREQYVRFDTPVDSIVGDPSVAEHFTTLVKKAYPSDPDLAVKKVSERLFALRKRGADNGGLPRLRRSYRGRGSSHR